MSARRRDDGTVAVIVALLLPILLGLMALAIDLGHGWMVKNQQQNAVDAAALAGVRDLDGTAAQFPIARASAVQYAALHQADGQPVNVPDGNVTLGNWNFNTRTFTAYDGTMMPYRVNAVQVTAPVLQMSTWFAPVIGINSSNVQSTAIAVGGSPNATCGFPLAVPACALLNDNGTVRCNSQMTFGRATTDNVGFTLLQPNPPVNTPGINCEVARALGFPCPGGCSCTQTCNPTSISDGAIYISNGNNLSSSVVDWINRAIAANPNGLYVQVPVLDSGSLTNSSCGDFQFNRTQQIVGYVEMKVIGASQGPPKTITVSVDCSRTSNEPPGGTGGFFGYRSTQVYLVK